MEKAIKILKKTDAIKLSVTMLDSRIQLISAESLDDVWCSGRKMKKRLNEI